MQYYKHTTRRPINYPTGMPDMAAAQNEPMAAFDKGSECKGNEDFRNPSSLPILANQSLGMAYVPYQKFEDTNEPAKALECGTLFRALYFPFYGQRRRSSL